MIIQQMIECNKTFSICQLLGDFDKMNMITKTDMKVFSIDKLHRLENIMFRSHCETYNKLK